MGADRIIRAGPLKATAQYVGGLALAAFFVVLLSFTFSFLGTILCAALSGMMLGALRSYKWHAIPVSLLFPLVIFTLLKGMKTELGGRQVIFVALACFATFWLTYGVAALLFRFEGKGQPLAGCSAPSRPMPDARPSREQAAQTAGSLNSQGPKANGWLSLEMLQGDWFGQTGAHTQFQSCRISIHEERLTLLGVDSSGHARILARAQLKLDTVSTPQTGQPSEPAAEADPDTLVSI